MGLVGGRGFGGSVKFVDGKTSSANVAHLNAWGFDISAAEKTYIFNINRPKGLFTPKACVFFCCGNSAADISKPHAFKRDPLANDVLEAA